MTKYINAGLYGLIILMALSLKLHYRRADASQLTWILGPTATAVELLGGLTFEKEIDTSYLDAGRGVLIAPACAGVNFMIICFGAGSLAGMRRPNSPICKLRWIMLMPLAAYALTVAANALRIVLSIKCYYWEMAPMGLSPEGLHRMLGTTVYFFCLWLFYMLLHQNRIRRQKHRRDRPPAPARARRLPSYLKAGLVPLGGYWLVTVIVPVLNAGLTGGAPGMTGHIRAVIIVSLGLFGVLQVISTTVTILTRRR